MAESVKAPRDRYLLQLQIDNRIMASNGADFQAFFEAAMEEAYPDFVRVRIFRGDGGNDGFQRKAGVYFQAYAPILPEKRLVPAAKKALSNFETLRTRWDDIVPIMKYVFVFNDKFGGTIEPVEAARAELANKYPHIEFDILRAIDLRRICLELDDAALLKLGFFTDARDALSIATRLVDGIALSLDREEVDVAERMLEFSAKVVADVRDEGLNLELALLECRVLQKRERHIEAEARYRDLAIRFPSDPQPLLLQAEIRLSVGDDQGNLVLLQEAERIDPDHWLLHVQRIVRELALAPRDAATKCDPLRCPQNPREAAVFFRVGALALQFAAREADADSFIASSRRLNSERFAVYVDEMRILQHRMLESEDAEERLRLSKRLLERIAAVEGRYTSDKQLSSRTRLSLEVLRLTALVEQERVSSVERVSRVVFELALACQFDREIESALVLVLGYVQVHADALRELLEYLRLAGRRPSGALRELLFAQFCLHQKLSTEGRGYFQSINETGLLELIDAVESNDLTRVLTLLEGKHHFALLLAGSLKGRSEIRRALIEHLPEDKDLQREKLRLLLNLDERDYDEAFQILRRLDLAELNYAECRHLFQLAHHKKAWEFLLILVEKLLAHEENDEAAFFLKVHRFEALQQVGDFRAMIDLGIQLLRAEAEKPRLDEANGLALLSGTVVACLERGKVDPQAWETAVEILQSHPAIHRPFGFKLGLEAESYILAGRGKLALQSIVDGVRVKEGLSGPEYARLYFHFVRLQNLLKLDQESLLEVQDGTFVRLAESEAWYWIGNGNALDAIPIAPDNALYAEFMGRHRGAKIALGGKYGPELREESVEEIFTVEQYIFWQAIHNFQELAPRGVLDGVQVISIGQRNDQTDFQNLVRFFEDIESKTGPLFDKYCTGVVPLALLAISEGGLTEALGRIGSEDRGFVHCSVGTPDERDKQLGVARKILDNRDPFYLDASSAVMLAESGIMARILPRLPGLRVPQSVINYLAETGSRFAYSAGQTGHLQYSRGQLVARSIELEKRERIRSRFLEAIRILEANPTNIRALSAASKEDVFAETRVPSELVDACVLARNEGVPVLTEDFRYTQMNEAETGRKAPPYFSSLALMRALYERGRLDFAAYLDYFGLLSSYRFRFLSLSPEDLHKAVLGDGPLNVAVPLNMKKFNLALTLSEEYGVNARDALRVVGAFLMAILRDTTVTPELARLIFIETIGALPGSFDKRALGQILIRAYQQALQGRDAGLVARPANPGEQQKLQDIQQLTELYSWQDRIRAPRE